MLQYEISVLQHHYKPYLKFMYLDTNLKNNELDVTRPLNEKIDNIINSIKTNTGWVNSPPALLDIAGYNTNVFHEINNQSKRNIEIHRHYRHKDLSYSEVNKIIGENKIYNKFEKNLLKAINEIDDEYLLTKSLNNM